MGVMMTIRSVNKVSCFFDEALSCFMATNAKIPDDLAEVLADGTYALIRLAELAMDDEE